MKLKLMTIWVLSVMLFWFCVGCSPEITTSPAEQTDLTVTEADTILEETELVQTDETFPTVFYTTDEEQLTKTTEPLQTTVEEFAQDTTVSEDPVPQGMPISSSQILQGVKIGLDPGHQRYGNSEQEAIAPGSSETKNKVTGGAVGVSTGIPEYVTVLEISQLLRDKLEAQGATVYMTRESHDVDISNQERTKMMNEYGVDLMLRIHCDSSESQSSNGCALYVSQSNEIAEQSRAYAEMILPAICDATAAKNNGIIQNDNYTGQNWAEVPCIMIECGFVSNPVEDQLLNSADYQERLTDGICTGIIACFSDAEEPQPLTTKAAVDDVLTPFLNASGVSDIQLENCEQLVVVQSDGTNAAVYRLEMADGIWKECSKTYGVVGKNGVSSEAREGLSYTPKGIFPLGFAFGTQWFDDLAVEYRQINQNCYWVDDPESTLYNQWVESSNVTWNSAEHLADYPNSYKYSVVIGYNMNPIIPYAGSAFFLHCMTGSYTAGCVAVSENEMFNTLQWLDEKKNPMILIY